MRGKEREREREREYIYIYIPSFPTSILGSLSMVLNALHIDPGRKWKGPWRWFAQETLGCCKTLEEVKKNGTTLSEYVIIYTCFHNRYIIVVRNSYVLILNYIYIYVI